MRYLIDEDLATDIARIARRLGLDVVSVHEVNREGWTDEQQLAQAAAEERCVVTANRGHFEDLTDQFAIEGRSHAGVLVVQGALRSADPSAVAHALLAFDNARGDFPAEYLFDFLRRAD